MIIIDAVIDEKCEKEEKKQSYLKLMLDMVMIAHTNKGKERSLKEWEYILGGAGFSGHTITPVSAIQYSVIQAFP